MRRRLSLARPARRAAAPPARDTRDVILDVAARRFAERGFAAVSMRALASEAGLRNQASLYDHFRILWGECGKRTPKEARPTLCRLCVSEKGELILDIVYRYCCFCSKLVN